MIVRDIYYDGSLVVTKCSGRVTAKELIDSEYWMIDNFGSVIKQGFCQLFDVMDADTSEISKDDIHRVAHINLNHGLERGEFTMAILTVKPYPLVLARLHKLLSVASHIRVEIFSEVYAAYKWMHVKNPEVRGEIF